MIGKFCNKIRQFHKDEKGSAIMEATFLYPSILIMAMVLLFMTIVVYQKAVVSYVAHTAADGIAHTWLNDTSNLGDDDGYNGKVTTYNTNGEDGLYWKLFEDNIITREIFNVRSVESSGATGSKLREGETYYSAKYNTTIKAELLTDGSCRIKVTATSPFKIPDILKNFNIESDVKAIAYAKWSDPVEGIRNVRVAIFAVDELRKKFKELDKVLEKIGF